MLCSGARDSLTPLVETAPYNPLLSPKPQNQPNSTIAKLLVSDNLKCGWIAITHFANTPPMCIHETDFANTTVRDHE